MCEHWSCRGKNELITQVSLFKISSSQPPFQEAYEFFSEKVCLKCGRVFTRYYPHGAWHISQEFSSRATTVSQAVIDKTWNEAMLPSDAVFIEHLSFLRLSARFLPYFPFFVPYIVIVFMFGVSLTSFFEVLSMGLVAVAVLYSVRAISLSRVESYRKSDGTRSQVRHPPDDLFAM